MTTEGSRVGAGLVARHLTLFDFEEGLEAESFQEIRLQAEEEGFELERVTSEERLPSGQWSATANAVTLRILITPGALQVELR